MRAPIILGDGNDIFLVVQQGLELGDEVALSPQAVMANHLEGLEASLLTVVREGQHRRLGPRRMVHSKDHRHDEGPC